MLGRTDGRGGRGEGDGDGERGRGEARDAVALDAAKRRRGSTRERGVRGFDDGTERVRERVGGYTEGGERAHVAGEDATGADNICVLTFRARRAGTDAPASAAASLVAVAESAEVKVRARRASAGGGGSDSPRDAKRTKAAEDDAETDASKDGPRVAA